MQIIKDFFFHRSKEDHFKANDNAFPYAVEAVLLCVKSLALGPTRCLLLKHKNIR